MSNDDKNERAEGENHLWEPGWEGHRRQQLKRFAALPLAEKLAWLEEAHRLVQHLKAQKTDSRKHS
jgi:hypothetical protein